MKKRKKVIKVLAYTLLTLFLISFAGRMTVIQIFQRPLQICDSADYNRLLIRVTTESQLLFRLHGNKVTFHIGISNGGYPYYYSALLTVKWIDETGKETPVFYQNYDDFGDDSKYYYDYVFLGYRNLRYQEPVTVTIPEGNCSGAFLFQLHSFENENGTIVQKTVAESVYYRANAGMIHLSTAPISGLGLFGLRLHPDRGI